MSENKKLFVCAIGPVQDFIATARTSQDLWFGSWMLSELSKAAARAISGEPHQLIFPAPEQDLETGSVLNVANKVVAIIEGDPEVIASQVEQAVNQRLEQVYQETYNTISGDVDRELAEKQINDLVEFYWASVPYTDVQGYKEARAQAEALLAARKNTRSFKQVNGCMGVPKSSLDGFRESVLRSSSVDAEVTYKDYHVKQGEELSGIDLLKRWGEIRAETFISTTDLAAMPFQIMLKEEAERLVRRIKNLLKDYTSQQETDGTMFYVERLVQLIDKDRRGEFRKRFVEIFEEESIHQSPGPYYALLLADGDNIGKTIDAQDGVEKHRRLSLRLSEFASAAHRLIVDRGGAPIYAGGDDVLAYLPLHTALRCISDLNDKFNEYMEGFSYQSNGASHTPTLSGALVIAHHLTPLSNVLDTAREAERAAKRISGKNALVIVLSKRSGAERTVSARMGDLLERMPVLIGYVRQKQISAGIAYELQKLHQELSNTGLQPEAFQREAIRIIQRKHEAGGERDVQEQVQQQFKTWFQDQDLALDELAQEMIIAGEFAAAYEMARKEAQA